MSLSANDQRVADALIAGILQTSNPYKALCLWNDGCKLSIKIVVRVHSAVVQKILSAIKEDEMLVKEHPILKGLSLEDKSMLFDAGIGAIQLFHSISEKHPEHMAEEHDLLK